jgi:hypothetical protein
MLSFAESKYLLDLMSLEDHIHTIDLVNEKLEFHRTLNKNEVISCAPIQDLIDELCKRSNVVEYKHCNDTYYEIVKWNYPRIINGYKNIDPKARIFVING